MHAHAHTHAHILYIYTYSHTRTYAHTRMHTHHHHRNNLGKSVCIIELHVFHTMSGTQTMGIGPIVITPSRNNGRQLICLFQYQFTDRQCILTSSNVRRTWQTEVASMKPQECSFPCQRNKTNASILYWLWLPYSTNFLQSSVQQSSPLFNYKTITCTRTRVSINAV